MPDRNLVYVLRSESNPDRFYVGLTTDVTKRLQWHNAVPVGHTSHHRPWKVVATFWFDNPHVASRFERYLKTGSGRAFSRRHFDSDHTSHG